MGQPKCRFGDLIHSVGSGKRVLLVLGSGGEWLSTGSICRASDSGNFRGTRSCWPRGRIFPGGFGRSNHIGSGNCLSRGSRGQGGGDLRLHLVADPLVGDSGPNSLLSVWEIIASEKLDNSFDCCSGYLCRLLVSKPELCLGYLAMSVVLASGFNRFAYNFRNRQEILA